MEINSVIFIPVILISILALWKENHVLFMITAGISMMTGLYAPDVISGGYLQLGISVGLGLIAYSFLCIAWALRLMFWRANKSEV